MSCEGCEECDWVDRSIEDEFEWIIDDTLHFDDKAIYTLAYTNITHDCEYYNNIDYDIEFIKMGDK